MISKSIKKINIIFLYFSVLYYLLPFDASYFCSLATNYKGNETWCQKKKEIRDYFHFFDKAPAKHKPPLVKYKNRFDVDCARSITPSVKNIKCGYSKNRFLYVITCYEISFSLDANRGPPGHNLINCSTLCNYGCL